MGVRTLRASVVHAFIGALGLVFGMLSAAALAVGAVIPAALGLLAFLVAPLRAALDRLREGAER